MPNILNGTSNKTVKVEGDGDKTEQVVRGPLVYIQQMPGKQIRSKLVAGFNHWLQIPEDKVKAISEIIQMLHSASILLDDIQDNSMLRRGNPVAHNVYGLATTLNSANYVVFLALEKLIPLGKFGESSHVFTKHLLELYRGQGMDIYWRDTISCPTEEEYKQMVRQKTGGLFGLALHLMQVFSENKRNFQPMIDLLGMFFQIRDDYASLTSDDYAANKTYCEDLTEGKFSFPIVHAIRSNPKDNQVLSILSQKTEDNDVKRYCVGLMEKSFEYTRDVMKELEKKLGDEIASLGPNPYIEAVVESLSKIYKDSTKT